MQRKSELTAEVAISKNIETPLEEAEILLEMAIGEEDEEVAVEAGEMIAKATEAIKTAEVQRMLGGRNDRLNAIVSLNPGAGGTEAQDWADMLFRMYLRFAEKKGFATEILDYQDGEEAGLKGATFLVTGPFAYGLT